MLNDIGSALRWRLVGFVALALIVAVVAACQGGASDVVGGGGLTNAHTSITLVAYSVPEPGWSKVIPAFNASDEGKGVQVITSYGASGDQSRGVVDGKPADVVNFSVEPDITRLVKAGKVSKDWNTDATKGIPFGSVVTLVVRKGNPKNIKDWDDLLRPGVEVITPSPLSSGSAKWNLLAPYAVKSEGGRNSQAGVDFVGKLVREHVKLRPGSGREATDVFVQGSGDVLISYENEAIATERAGKPVEHVNPAADLQDRKSGGGGDHQPAPGCRDRVQELPIHRRGAEGVGAGRFSAGRSGRCRRLPRPVPGAGETVDHRRPRWLEHGGSAAVRQEHRQHHQDLYAGHRMTASERSGPNSTSPTATVRTDSRRAPRADRATRRFGSVWRRCGFR